MNSKVACQKLLGNLQQRNLGGLSFWTQPNSWHHFMSDHIVTFSVLPSIRSTLFCARRGSCIRTRSRGATTTPGN